MEPHASPLVTYGIAALALGVCGLVVTALLRITGEQRRWARAAALVAVAWVIISAGLARSGVLARFDARPPPLLLVILPTVGLPLALALSPLGARLSATLPLWVLVGVHAFRLPLELVMHVAAREGTMPPQMTFTGSNLDIVSGITAIGVALALRGPRPSRALVMGWNVLGSALLLTIVVVAVASTPLFQAFGPEALNTWVAYFPFVWLPAILVAAALLGHLLLWRRLLRPAPHGVGASAASARPPR